MGKYKYTGTANHLHAQTDANGVFQGYVKLKSGDVVEMDDNTFAQANLSDRFTKVDGGDSDQQLATLSSGGVRPVGGGSVGMIGDQSESVPPDPTRFTYSETSDHSVQVVGDDQQNGAGDGSDVVDDDQLLEQEQKAKESLLEQVGQQQQQQVTTTTQQTTTSSKTADSSTSTDISTLTVPEVKTIISQATTKAEVRKLLDYEKANLNRTTVVSAAESKLSQLDK